MNVSLNEFLIVTHDALNVKCQILFSRLNFKFSSNSRLTHKVDAAKVLRREEEKRETVGKHDYFSVSDVFSSSFVEKARKGLALLLAFPPRSFVRHYVYLPILCRRSCCSCKALFRQTARPKYPLLGRLMQSRARTAQKNAIQSVRYVLENTRNCFLRHTRQDK